MTASLTPAEQRTIARRANKQTREAIAATRSIELPALPPKTERELAHDRDITAMLMNAVSVLRQSNLNNAVLLAQQAAAGHGPLVDHFAELGRRYCELLKPQQGRPGLRVVKGGREP